MKIKKFRVWDTKNNQFLSQSSEYYHIGDITGIPYTLNEILNKLDRFVVQQFTGLKDSKGVNVYEGDIIQYNMNSSYDNMNFEVKFYEETLGWIFQSKTGEVLVNEWTPRGNRFNFIEVVGNIFENSELLKQ